MKHYLPPVYQKKKQSFLRKNIEEATFRQNQLKGHKSSYSKKFKKGEISEEGLKKAYKGIDQDFEALRDYKKYYSQKLKTIQHSGSGIRRKKKRRKRHIFQQSKRTSEET